MTIEFSCAGCGRAMRAPESAAGKQGQCPQCGQRTTIPSPEPAEAAASAPQPAATAAGTIEFACPSCGKTMKTPASAAGKKGKCPACNTVTTIPGAGEAAAPAAQAAPAGPIEFFCPSCGKTVKTPGSAAGKKGKCPHCQSVVDIPKQSAKKLSAPRPPAPSQAASQGGLTPLPDAGLTPIDGGLTPLGGGLSPFGGPAPLGGAGPFGAPAPFGGGMDDLLGPAAPGGFGAPLGGADPFGGAGMAGPFGGGGGAPAWGGAPGNPYAAPATVASGGGARYGGPPNDSNREGLPWERRDADSKLWGTVWQVLTAPGDSFDQMRRTGGLGTPIQFVLTCSVVSNLILMLYAFIFLVVNISLVLANPPPNATINWGALFIGVGIRFTVQLLFSVVGGAVSSVIGALIGAGIIHLTLMLVGGARYGYEVTFRVMAYASGANQMLAIIPCVGVLIMLFTYPLTAIVGLARAHQTDGWRAALAYFLPMLVACGLAALFIFMSGVAIFSAIARMSGQGAGS